MSAKWKEGSQHNYIWLSGSGETEKLINSNEKLDNIFFDIEYAKGSIFSCIKQLKH